MTQILHLNNPWTSSILNRIENKKKIRLTVCNRNPILKAIQAEPIGKYRCRLEKQHRCQKTLDKNSWKIATQSGTEKSESELMAREMESRIFCRVTRWNCDEKRKKRRWAMSRRPAECHFRTGAGIQWSTRLRWLLS